MFSLRTPAVLAGLALGVGSSSAFAATIAQWTFESDTGAYTYPSTALNSPVPEVGSGTATPLGMTNSYTFNGGEGPGSLTWCDTVSPGGPGASGSSVAWRVRGPSNSSGGGAGISNGWNNQAPQYTQGASFAVSTVTYHDISMSFDWLTTTQGVADLQPRYSTDGGATWTNFGSSLEMTAADVNTNFDTFTLNFTGVPGVDGNPNFAVELVSAYNPKIGTDYANAKWAATGTATSGNADTGEGINNSSGNWRFDNITFTGTQAVPEPASIAVLGLGAAGLLTRRRTRARAHLRTTTP